jgi:hypothetical protein
MTWRQKHAFAAQHFGLTEADITEVVLRHTHDGGRVYRMLHCTKCDESVSLLDCESVRVNQGKVVLVVDP